MIIVKSNTVKGQALLRSTSCYEGFYLDDVYGRYSRAKACAWERCRDEFARDGGVNFHIYSHTYQFFCVSWDMPHGRKVVTPYNTYFVQDA